MKIRFTKMHGAGNDYIFINCHGLTLKNPSKASVKLSNRHLGVGSDGLVLILPSNNSDFKMRMFNADGSEAQMCGNAIRCLGKYVYERGLTTLNTITVETDCGEKALKLEVNDDGEVSRVCVDMGSPVIKASSIPVIHDKDEVVNEQIMLHGQAHLMTCVSIGNPHAVFFVDAITDEQIFKFGPEVESMPCFPEKTNVEFAQILNRNQIKMRVFERGSGETKACGTGACAVLTAAVLNDLTDRKATVELTGGCLDIEWAEDGRLYMTGPAVDVFDGEIDIGQ